MIIDTFFFTNYCRYILVNFCIKDTYIMGQIFKPVGVTIFGDFKLKSMCWRPALLCHYSRDIKGGLNTVHEANSNLLPFIQ